MTIDLGYLPDGWTSEEVGTSCILITGKLDGQLCCYVTVDLAHRVFRSGCDTTGKAASTRPDRYNGRGWRQRLIADAVAWLQEIIDGPPVTK